MITDALGRTLNLGDFFLNLYGGRILMCRFTDLEDNTLKYVYARHNGEVKTGTMYAPAMANYIVQITPDEVIHYFQRKNQKIPLVFGFGRLKKKS